MDDQFSKKEHDERLGMGFGAMPGMNQSPVNPSFRDLDAPGGAPRLTPWWVSLSVIVVGIAVVAFIVLT